MTQQETENFDFISTNVLPPFGIDGEFDDKLKARLKEGLPDFTLSAETVINKNNMKFDFKFEKIATNSTDERYYLNEIKATLHKEGEEPLEQIFRIFNQRFVDMEKMHRLMHEKAVTINYFRDNKPTVGWLQINSRGECKLYSSDNFSLVRELGKVPLNNYTQRQKEDLMYKLQNGLPAIADVKLPNGTVQKLDLVVKPQLETIFAYDVDGKRVPFGNKIQVVNDQAQIQSITPNGTNQEVSETTRNLMEKAEATKNTQNQNLTTRKGISKTG